MLNEEGNFSKLEGDFFYFVDFGHDFNLALRGFAAQTNQDRFYGQYFVGGFDSIRGYPDGISFGQKVGFGTIEMRRIFSRLHYLWTQSAVFLDAGSTADEWGVLGSSIKRAAGVGVRLSVPQVYRFVVRIDYAWSLDGSGARGITAGLNQFFDPYKPL